MNNKTHLKHICLYITIALSMKLFSSGIYLVSSADFRHPYIKYTIDTTEPNQEVEVTPYALKSFSTISGVQTTKPYVNEGWSIKYDGINKDIDKNYAIRQNTQYVGLLPWNTVQSLAPNAENMTPITHSFAKPGKHMVNIYSPTWNIFSVMISNDAVSSISIDLEYLPYNLNVYSRWGVSIVDSQNLNKIIYKNPINSFTELRDFRKLSNLREFTIKHPETIISLAKEVLFECTELEGDWIFPNVTNVGYNCFRNCKKINYVSFPRAKSILGYAFSLSTTYSEPLGIHTLKLGDGLSYIATDLFARQNHITTIEFVTDESNWIEAWNNHPILPNWLGTASNQVENEATLTPVSNDNITYYSGSFKNYRPKPTKLVYVGGYDVN